MCWSSLPGTYKKGVDCPSDKRSRTEEHMLKYLSLMAVCALVAVSMSFANQSTTKVVIPVDRTVGTNGKQMFTSYCAPCHGTDGRGHGPVAAALKTQPRDLTELRRQHNGKFPDAHVVAVLQFGPEVRGHEPSEMPAWAHIFVNMNPTNLQSEQLRICNLTRYLETIQAN